MNDQPTMLLVLGVHRSGTSTVARLLECIGAKPSSKLVGLHPRNPKGFFEDRDIIRFHRNEMMPALGMDWHDVAPPDWTMIGPQERTGLLNRAREILLSNFCISNPLSVVKEPRITLLLPFWLEAFGLAGFKVKAVCVVRDPLSVARSLRARSGFSIAKGSAIYTSNWLSALPYLKGLDASFVAYDSLFSDARAALVIVSQELGIPFPSDFDQRLKVFSEEFLDPGLRHSVLTSEELDAEPELVPASLAIHRSLMQAKGGTFFHGLPDHLAHQMRWLADSTPMLRDYDLVFKRCQELALKSEQIEGTMRGDGRDVISIMRGLRKKSFRSTWMSIQRRFWRRP